MPAAENTARVRPLHEEAQPANGNAEVVALENPKIEIPNTSAPKAEGPAPTTTAAQPGSKPRGRGGRRRIVVSVIALVALAGAGWWGYNYMAVGRFMVSTDDAYVGGDIATISPKLSGYVANVDVTANQPVKAGDALVTLDDGDYTIARDQAQATIDTQNLTLKRIDAQIEGAKAGVTQAEAERDAAKAAQQNAALTADRAKSLTASAVGAQSTLDAANATLQQANANVSAAEAAITAANANITVLEGQRAEAASALKSQQLVLDKANRDLSFTVLRAPYDGVVGNLAVQKGDLVSAGVKLAAIVPTDALYVDANFKETQLAQLVPGEKVAIHLDADESDPIEGTVQSLAPASGAVFSLLPPENATGNFTKVVQRVPVRIKLPEDALKSGRLRAGLSVTVDADTRTIPRAN